LTIKLTQAVAAIEFGWPSRGAQRRYTAVPLLKVQQEQVRLSTNCSARAEFAENAPLHHILSNAAGDAPCQPIQLSKNNVSGSTGPPRSRRDVRPCLKQRRETNKKPGVERRANPPTQTQAASRDARLLSIRYS
jgi:hypothetical protein